MKQIKNLYFIAIAVLTLAFVGCSSDNDNRSEYTFNAVCQTQNAFKGHAGQETKSAEYIVPIDDMLKGNDYVPPVIKSSLYISDAGTDLAVVGLKDGIKLTNVTITINGVSKTFAEINETNANLYTNDMVDFMTKTFGLMISWQKLDIKMVFTPNVDISAENNIYLKVSYSGRFTYLK